MPRTKRSVEIALEAIGHPPIGMREIAAFVIESFVRPGPILNELSRIETTMGATATAAQWLEQWDSAARVRDMLRQGMSEIAQQYADRAASDATVLTFLVGYHGPLAGFAADNAEDIGPIRTADVVVYYVSRNAAGELHFHGVHWPCPLHN